MLLRRITNHVRDQNWFAVFIDFLIVVVGVFIGIQVANWNSDITEQARGESIKTRLVAEFIEIEYELARHVHAVSDFINIGEQLSEDILAGQIEWDTKEFADRLSSLRWRPPSGGSNTIAELISQGDMDILHSPSLVEKLLRFDTLANRHTSNNLALRSLIEDDRNTLSKLGFLAAIPPQKRSEEFAQHLAERAATADIYLSTKNTLYALDIDLSWYQESLKRACAILQELKESCRASETMPPVSNT